jgi:WD40 repeat protein
VTAPSTRLAGALLAGALAMAATAAAQESPAASAPAARPVSFYKDVRPILTANCAGCHQPAKAGGKLAVTSHAAILAARGDDPPALVPGNPDESDLLLVLLPSDGKPPRMPKGRTPLSEKQVETIRRWIAEGASDDTPAAATEQYTMDRPPVYRQQPVVTALDFSQDGRTLAVSGYHEVLLYEVAPSGEGARLEARLVGLSERIQSAEFSPDGSQLLVVGGSPARLGETQFWNVAERKLRLSIPLGFDTLYGGSWSPDGRLVALGGGDNTVRALDAASGEQVFFNAASEDLVLDTAFSTDASHLVSVGRDRALKLYQMATQQFLDNVTSITPGALKGGLIAVDRHPARDELLIGGADGTPKTYRMHRTQQRRIGDDFNLVKAYAPLAGRVFAVEWAPDGERFVAASSADRAGEVRVYASDHEPPVWTLKAQAPIYAATWRSDGTLVAAGGFDGRIFLVDAASGRVVGSFSAAPVRL